MPSRFLHARGKPPIFRLLLALTLIPCPGCLFGGPGGSADPASGCGPDQFDPLSGLSGLSAKSANQPGAGRGPASLEEDLGRATQRMLYLGSQGGSSAGAGLGALQDRRASLLGQSLRSDPSVALRAAVPADNASAGGTDGACAERRSTVSGIIQPVAVDGSGEGHVEFVLRDDAGQAHLLHFAGAHAPGFRGGDRVEVSGLRIPCGGEGSTAQSISPRERVSADSLVVPKGGARVLTETGPVPGSSLARTLGAQSTAAILLNFQDEALSSTADDVRNVVFSQVDGYFREASDGQTWLTGQVLGPYTIAQSSQDCDAWTTSNLALAAAQDAGIDLSQYTHFIYVFPQNSCYWLGLGTIGGLPSEAWINASLTLHTVAHELGHNLGLYHSHALDCGTGASVGASCANIEYGDTADVMGNLVPGHYNSFQKERLGWLDFGISPLINTISQDGTYTINPYEAPSADTKALKVLESVDATTGASTYYYLEYRQPQGYDQILGMLLVPNNLTSGILIHSGSESDPNSSDLLNMNPAGASWYEAGLNVGQGFTDPSTQASFTLVSASASQATVTVSLGSDRTPCVRGAPTVAISPSVGIWAPAGATLTYTVSVQDNDSEGCAASAFTLGATPPPGWNGALGTTSLSLTPGNLGTASYQLSSPTTAGPGAYSLRASASSPESPYLGQSAPATPLVAASTGLTVVALPDQPLYSPGNPIRITVYAASAGADAAGVSYTLTVTRPDGTQALTSGRTGADGTSQQVFELSSCALSGSYGITLAASLGAASGTDSRTFAVY